MSGRRRHVGSRDQPERNHCLGVFGLSLYTTERELEKEFSKFGPIQKLQVVLDGKTGRSRGFGFVYYEALDDAQAAKEAMCDTEIDGRRIRVDYSITKRPHTPTPGVYMGRPTYSRGGGGGRGHDRGGGKNLEICVMSEGQKMRMMALPEIEKVVAEVEKEKEEEAAQKKKEKQSEKK